MGNTYVCSCSTLTLEPQSHPTPSPNPDSLYHLRIPARVVGDIEGELPVLVGVLPGQLGHGQALPVVPAAAVLFGEGRVAPTAVQLVAAVAC